MAFLFLHPMHWQGAAGEEGEAEAAGDAAGEAEGGAAAEGEDCYDAAPELQPWLGRSLGGDVLPLLVPPGRAPAALLPAPPTMPTTWRALGAGGPLLHVLLVGAEPRGLCATVAVEAPLRTLGLHDGRWLAAFGSEAPGHALCAQGLALSCGSTPSVLVEQESRSFAAL